MKSIIYRFVLLCGTALLFSCDQTIAEESSTEEEVARINKLCPRLIDEETRIESVVYTKPSLIIYNYTLVNVNKQLVDTAQFRMHLWPGILSTIRVDQSLGKLREREMNFEYRYFDQSKELIYTFKIGPEQYNP